jgi:hypothetical protein
MLKIVDTFNGYEGQTYATRAEAEQALDAVRAAFYAQPDTTHTYFCKAIVPAEYSWYWHPGQNQFVWG